MGALQRAFHTIVDNLDAIAARLFSLPLSFLFVAIVATAALIVLGLRRVSQRARHVLAGERLRWASMFFALAMMLVLFDARQRRLEAEVRELTRELSFGAGGEAERGTTTETLRLSQELRGVFRDAKASRSRLAEGIEYIAISARVPRLVMTHLTIVDLTRPGLRIELPSDISTKTKLSDFCGARGCVVGLNGEAGETPAPTAPLGKWVGTMVVGGHAISSDGPEPRPFIAFRKDNTARYVSQRARERSAGASAFNAIWGRWDLIVDGATIAHFERPDMLRPRPRCAMGVSADGKRLFLLTADGQQRGYSDGMTMPEVASVLHAFGAGHAMACDEGGSAAMYLGARKGLVSRPPLQASERERPTYTHFGVSTVGG